MNPAARILLLLGAFVLLVFGIVCLKQRMGPEPTPPAFIPANAAGTAGHQADRGNQPTILSAEPIQHHDMDATSPSLEYRPVPLEDTSEPIAYPINTTSPTFPRDGEVLPPTADPPRLEPTGDLEPIDAAAVTPPPGEGAFEADPPNENETTSAPLNEPIQAVITESGDSLWTISERVYGRGDFYRALFLHNRVRILRADRIVAGVLVATPSVSELRRLYPEACPKPDPLAAPGG